MNLTPGSTPPLTLTVLKPYDDAMAFLTRLNHTLLTLGFLAVFAGGAGLPAVAHIHTAAGIVGTRRASSRTREL